MEDFSFRTLELVGLGTGCAFAGLFYYLSKKKQRTVDRLDEAPHLPVDEKLVTVVNAAPGKCLQYVVIEGTVQPVGEPLRSQFQEGCVGVVQKLVLREHKLVWNSLARTWTDSERILHQRISAVPFNLLGSHQASVRVLCPLEASGLHMELIHKKFHQASYGFSDVIGQYLSGEKPKGQLETEEMLKVGATLTGVGELFLDTDRTLKLRPPTDGSQFFLSPADFESMRAEQDGVARLWRVLAGACAVAAVAVLTWVGRRYYRHLRDRWERERFQPDGREDETEQDLCVVCLSRPRGCVLLDCGHVCCCYSCYQALPRPVCPICRGPIKRVVPLFRA